MTDTRALANEQYAAAMAKRRGGNYIYVPTPEDKRRTVWDNVIAICGRLVETHPFEGGWYRPAQNGHVRFYLSRHFAEENLDHVPLPSEALNYMQSGQNMLYLPVNEFGGFYLHLSFGNDPMSPGFMVDHRVAHASAIVEKERKPMLYYDVQEHLDMMDDREGDSKSRIQSFMTNRGFLTDDTLPASPRWEAHDVKPPKTRSLQEGTEPKTIVFKHRTRYWSGQPLHVDLQTW